MSKSMRRALALALVAVVAGVTGCASIPTSGPVEVGNVAGTSPDLGVDFVPVGPVDGDDPVEIVRGFIAAGNGPQDDYQTARSFLSEEFAPVWEPNANVLVYQGAAEATQNATDSVTLSVQPVATVDETGHLVERGDDPDQLLDFQLVQEGGEWRISQAANGIVLLDAIFDQAFAEHALYFLDPTGEYLVPDLRWFASRDSVSTRIVSELLSGPSAWLSRAVTSAFPEGTQLAIDSVPVTDSKAYVELTPEVLTVSDAERSLMLAQLESSLRTVTSISSAVILVNQEQVEVTRTTGDPRRNPLVDGRPLVLSDGEFGYLGDDELFPIEGLSDAIVELDPAAVMVSASRAAAAALTADGAWRVGSTGTPELVDGRDGQIPPVLDNQGYIWSVSNSSTTPVRISRGGESTEFAMPWLNGAPIVSFDISRDGTRALVFARGTSGPILAVVGVLRDGTEPIELNGEPFFLDGGTGQALDAAWVNELGVASVTVTEDGTGLVVSQSIGGTSQTLTSIAAPVSIAAGNLLDGVQVLTESGVVLIPRGSRWSEARADVSLLATQYP